MLTLVRRLLAAKHLAEPEVFHVQARRASIEPAMPMPIESDGETRGATPVGIEVVPRALRVLL